jgi:hypothetical protein
MRVTQEDIPTNVMQSINEVFLDFLVIPNPLLFREGHLIQPIHLEKADKPLKD